MLVWIFLLQLRIMKENNFEQPAEISTKVEILDSADELSLGQIRNMEEEIFDWEVSDTDLDELINKIKSPESITSVIKNSEGGIQGYVLGVPSLVVENDLKAEDPDFVGMDSMLYIDTLAIAKESRGDLRQVKNLIQTLLDEAETRNYKLVSAHVPIHHFSMYKRYSEAEIIRTLENWFDSGEDHYYIELKI